MDDYILYCLDGNKLLRCERFVAANEEAAIHEALRRQGTSAGELWCGARRVKIFAKGKLDA